MSVVLILLASESRRKAPAQAPNESFQQIHPQEEPLHLRRLLTFLEDVFYQLFPLGQVQSISESKQETIRGPFGRANPQI